MQTQITNICQKNWRKWSQNGPNTSPKSILEGLWRPLVSLKQGAYKTSFLTILAPFWDPFGTSLSSCLASFFYVFLKCFFDGFGLHLGSQNTSKMRPKRVPKTHLIKKWKSNSRLHESSIQRGVGVLKIIIFSMFFWNPVLGGHGEPIVAILAHFWGPFWRPFWLLFRYHCFIYF